MFQLYTLPSISASSAGFSGTITGSNVVYTGVPDPEGTKTADPGSLYWRTDVPNQVSGLYVKNVGTNSVGWVEIISF